MRQFFLGIAATVVGGFILFWLTNWYTGWATDERYQVEFQSDPAVAFLSTGELAAIESFKKAGEFASGKIGIVRIENLSNADIRNAEFVISPTESKFSDDNLYGFGVASYVSGAMPDPSLERTEEGVVVKFPIFEKENGAYIWLLHEPPQGFRVFSGSEKFNLSESTRWDQESELDFLFVFLIGIGALVLGLWAGSALSDSILKEAGYDPKKVQADYHRRLAEKKDLEAQAKTDA